MKGPCSLFLLLFWVGLAAAENIDGDETERLVVKGQVPAYQRGLSAVLPATDILDSTNDSIDSLSTLLSSAPEVNLNGQGGLLQAINVRGFARWRIQTLVEGVPIYTERRAGSAAEFLPPSFVGGAFLTPGAASTQLGSGALGGGVDLALARPQHASGHLSYGHNQDYRELLLQSHHGSDDPVLWQFSHRVAGNGDDGSGNPLFDQFEQNAFSLRKIFHQGPYQEALLLYSESNNIGKASADLPQDRITLYPTNDHVLGKVSLNWHNATVYWHQSRLDTQINRPGRRENILRNDALDFGASLNNALKYHGWQLHWRANLDARSGVKAYERELDSQDNRVFERLNLDAEQVEVSGSVDAARDFPMGTVSAGTRLAHQHQRDTLTDVSAKDTNLSGFFAFTRPLSQRWNGIYYLSSGYRVPNLTERFFSGSTPRGRVLGDPRLRTEHAWNQELSLDYQNGDSSARFSLFHQRIDNYIERLPFDDELLLYRNLNRATIDGLTYRWQQAIDLPVGDWQLRVGGQWLWGNDDNGQPIADIVPAQHRFSLQGQWQNSEGFLAITHRQASRDQVAGELMTPSVTTLDMGYRQALSARWEVQVQLFNVTDKAYVTTRDDLAPLARGRDLRITLSFR